MQPGFFDHQERLGAPLPKLVRSVDRETFRTLQENRYTQSNPRKGGRPPFSETAFWENASVNLGLCVKVLRPIDSAMQWLDD